MLPDQQGTAPSATPTAPSATPAAQSAPAPLTASTVNPVTSVPDAAISQSSSSQAAPAPTVSARAPPQQQLQTSFNSSNPSSFAQLQPHVSISLPRPASLAPSSSYPVPHPAPVVKLPPKKEKTTCLFCTKPARSTCPFKLCKKCCNERHPNDCKAHDSGPANTAAKAGDKSKQQKPQPLPTPAAKPDVSLSVPHLLGHPQAAAPGPPELAPVSKDAPDAFDLTSTVAAFQQEQAEVRQWQSAVRQRTEQQHKDAAAEACHRYLVNAHLLASLFKDLDHDRPSDQEVSAARLKRLKPASSSSPQDAPPKGTADVAARAAETVTPAAETCPADADLNDLAAGTCPADADLNDLAADARLEIPVRRTCFIL